MSSVHEVQWRVMRERIRRIAADAGDDDDKTRLALCCLAVLERHRVDGNGHCRLCRKRRGSWWRASSWQCTVMAVVRFYLEQPSGMIRCSGAGMSDDSLEFSPYPSYGEESS